MNSSWSSLGCGVGLRAQHYPDILDRWPSMDWFEAISENFMDSEGRPIAVLEKVRAHYPLALHGVALSIGSTDPLSERYLDRLTALVRRIDPAIVSDHLCWTGVDGENLHDLLPLPFTEEAIAFIAERVLHVQERIGRKMLLENVSAYVTYQHSTMPEWEFLKAVAQRSGCGILLDLNNVYVNAVNHQFDPMDYCRAIPGDLVGQFHLGGHSDKGSFLFDTHGAAVVENVWNLYREALALYGPVSTLIEWDENIPSFERLAEEAARAREIYSIVRTPSRGGMLAGAAIASNVPPRDGVRSAPHLRQTQILMKERIRLRREGKTLEKTLNPQGGEPGGERMAVYAGAYVARVVEALKETFEAVARFSGERPFIELCEGYVEAYPSGEYNLNEIGHAFSGYVAKTEIADKLPFLGDLARLEWAVSRAFHGRCASPIDPSHFSSWGEDEWNATHFQLQPGSAVISSLWPIGDLWNARKLPEGQIDLTIHDRPQTVFVYRVGLDVRLRVVSALEAEFLRRMLSGESLEVIGGALEGLGAEDVPVGDWFAALSRDGLVVGVA